jgi:hypothetical protein
MLLSVGYPTLVADICRRETPVEAISEQVRAVVEELWADLVPQLPPRVSQG